MGRELAPKGIAVNALWPKTAIDTAAVRNLLGGETMAKQSRQPSIVADAAHAILTKPSREHTGHFHVDEDVLRAEGVTDFEPYAVEPGAGPRDGLFSVARPNRWPSENHESHELHG